MYTYYINVSYMGRHHFYVTCEDHRYGREKVELLVKEFRERFPDCVVSVSRRHDVCEAVLV